MTKKIQNSGYLVMYYIDITVSGLADTRQYILDVKCLISWKQMEGIVISLNLRGDWVGLIFPVSYAIMVCLHWAVDMTGFDLMATISIFLMFTHLLRNQGSKKEEGKSQRTWGYWCK